MPSKENLLSSILNRLLFERKMKPIELARKLGIPQPTMHRIVTGKSPNPHKSNLEPLAEYFDVTVEQLKGEEPLPENLWTDSLLPTKKVETLQIPILAWEQIPELEFPLSQPADDFLIIAPHLSPNCFATYMDDSSMEPQFEKGTTLIIDPGKPFKDRGFILVLLSETSTLVFRQVLIDADYKYLKALHPDLSAFPMRVVEEDDKIFGTLVEARRNYETF